MQRQQWEAIATNNSSYDGTFYYALSTTKTVCRPSCSSRTPNPKNISIFYTVEEALHQGYRPCQRCKPDQFNWVGYKQELANQTKQYIEQHYEEPVTLEVLQEVLQKNPYYILRSFKESYGMTPLQFLHQTRIRQSKELLGERHDSITVIGLEVGYNDSAHFSTKFKELEGITPKAFRKNKMK